MSRWGEPGEGVESRVPITLRMPTILRNRLAEQAKAAGMSLNSWVRRCLEAEDAKP